MSTPKYPPGVPPGVPDPRPVETIVDALAKLSPADRAAVVQSITVGVLQRQRDEGTIADFLGGALGCYGIAVFTLDEGGGRLLDGWNNDGPRGEHVDKIMNKVHDAIAAVVDAELINRREVH